VIKKLEQRGFVSKYTEWEEHHWWHLGRRKILLGLVRSETSKYLQGRKKRLKLLDIGCGIGKITSGLSKDFFVVGTDNDKLAIDIAKRMNETLRNRFIKTSGEKLPFNKNQFDVVIAFDVLEHIKDDNAALRDWRSVLKENGLLLIAVPGFPWMWGPDDVLAGHKRRYNKIDLIKKLKHNGYSILKITYFNFWLFPIISVVRLFKNKLLNFSSMSNKELFENLNFHMGNNFINTIIYKIFASESELIERVSFPFGVSLFISAMKKSSGHISGDESNIDV
jgi:2-polyprenyl-3-methyl-5-hydroxy-6-metoxy-1,4-benzoquinol methylase